MSEQQSQKVSEQTYKLPNAFFGQVGEQCALHAINNAFGILAVYSYPTQDEIKKYGNIAELFKNIHTVDIQISVL